VAEILKRPDAKFEDVADLVRGYKGAEMLKSGDTEGGIFWAGMIQGLIHDIPTCQVLIDRIMSDAESIIRSRLSGMLA
jgi:nitronate monooxygenase